MTSVKRSRGGCGNCKARRRRCTEERPSCRACVRKGIPCEYTFRLTWEEDAELAGIAFGRAGLKDRFSKDKKKKVIDHYILPLPLRAFFLNTTTDDILRFASDYEHSTASFERDSSENDEEWSDATDPRNHPTLAVDSSSLAPAITGQLRRHPDVGQNCSFLLDYYSNVVCHRRVLVDSSHNPFRRVLLPLCLSSQGLLHAVVAASANDLRNRKDIDAGKYENAVLVHKSKAMETLRTILVPDPSGKNLQGPLCNLQKGERDSILLTIMMLCYLEIATGSRRDWTAHLTGATSLVKSLSNPSKTDLFSTETLSFVYDFLSLRDTFSATTLDEQSYFANDKWTSQIPLLYPFLRRDNSSRINALIGLSPELLNIISSITSLARRKYQLRRSGSSSFSAETSFHESAMVLQERLRHLEQVSDTSDSDQLIYLNAAAFKEAAVIYLRHAAFDEPTTHTSIQSTHLPKLLDLIQQVHLKHGSLLGSLPYPMWALFIASCVVQERERHVVLDLFTSLQDMRPVSNVPRTMAAIEAIWKMKDLEQELPRSRACDSSPRVALDWEEPLGKLGWKMALS